MNKLKILLKTIYYKFLGIRTTYDEKNNFKHIDEVVNFDNIMDFPDILKKESLEKINRTDHPVKYFHMEMEFDSEKFARDKKTLEEISRDMEENGSYYMMLNFIEKFPSYSIDFFYKVLKQIKSSPKIFRNQELFDIFHNDEVIRYTILYILKIHEIINVDICHEPLDQEVLLTDDGKKLLEEYLHDRWIRIQEFNKEFINGK